jgi:hypothetical protein
MMRYLAFFLLLLCAACRPGSSAAAEQSAAICYVPIASGTSSPLTRMNFLQRCSDLGTLKATDPRFIKLANAIRSAPKATTFHDGGVRVRIVMPDHRIVFIDQAGGVDAGGVLAQLSEDALREVEDILDGLEEQRFPPSAGEASSPAARQFVTLCYVPFSEGGSAPVTRENIADKCVNLGKRKLTDRRLMNMFFELRKAAEPGTFNDHAVQAKIVRPDGRVIFLDRQGGLFSDGKTAQLSRESLANVERILGWMRDEHAGK